MISFQRICARIHLRRRLLTRYGIRAGARLLDRIDLALAFGQGRTVRTQRNGKRVAGLRIGSAPGRPEVFLVFDPKMPGTVTALTEEQAHRAKPPPRAIRSLNGSPA